MGETSAEALLERYHRVREDVACRVRLGVRRTGGTCRAAGVRVRAERCDGADDALIDHLELTGFRDPAATAQRLRGVLASRRVQVTQPAARTRIEQLLGAGLRAAAERSRGAGASHDIGQDELFSRFAQLIDVIAGRSTYVSLLHQFPAALDRVMRLLAASRWATDYLVRHPILLDELLDDRVETFDNEHTPDWSAWAEAVRARLNQVDGDQEVQMNVLRDAHHAQVFRLLVADLDGRLTVERLADHLSALADATLALTLECAWRTVPRRHRETPAFAVIGLRQARRQGTRLRLRPRPRLLFDDAHPDAAEIYLHADAEAA